jgi:PAS domain S-box-containing protein
MPLELYRNLPAAVTICDSDGVILEMNEAAVRTFAKYGGAELVGTNVLDCHPEPSRTMLARMLVDHSAHTYTIEKRGKRKLIQQMPWHVAGQYRGFVEISFEIPAEIPNQPRD